MVLSTRKILTLAALALAVGLAAGCGNAPNAPVPAGQTTMSSAAHGGAESAGLLDGAGSLLGGILKLVTKVLQVVGSVGGAVENGRWRVEIPPDAIEGSATISLGVLSASSPVCQLEISPATSNHFSAPVTLTVDCSAMSDSQLRGSTILWLNPRTGGWEPVAGASTDLAAKTISAPLQHFSTYACGPNQGRAGW